MVAGPGAEGMDISHLPHLLPPPFLTTISPLPQAGDPQGRESMGARQLIAIKCIKILAII